MMSFEGAAPLFSGGLGHQGTHPQAVQTAHVIGEADQTPLKTHFNFSPQEELPESHDGFDDADDGLDGLFPWFV